MPISGRPDLPAEPLAQRAAETGAGLDLNTAIKTIETRLAADPSDLRGWQVIAPAYMQLGRYADAVKRACARSTSWRRHRRQRDRPGARR